ncbi:MAG: hypothetical protein M1820_009288 [Bogoriella megaspora]|nr:MAG: hypothetical protein M1820_009288 [Bogoriella megaspora]
MLRFSAGGLTNGKAGSPLLADQNSGPVPVPVATVSEAVEQSVEHDAINSGFFNVQILDPKDPPVDKPSKKEVALNPKDMEEFDEKEKHKLQLFGRLSTSQMASVESSIIASENQYRRYNSAFKDKQVDCVEACDNKWVREAVREFITWMVPRNKQHDVRDKIASTLYTLLPPHTQSRMRGSDLSYRTGSMEPPGYENMCPSEYSEDEDEESDVKGKEVGEGVKKNKKSGKTKAEEVTQEQEVGSVEALKSKGRKRKAATRPIESEENVEQKKVKTTKKPQTRKA